MEILELMGIIVLNISRSGSFEKCVKIPPPLKSVCAMVKLRAAHMTKR